MAICLQCVVTLISSHILLSYLFCSETNDGNYGKILRDCLQLLLLIFFTLSKT